MESYQAPIDEEGNEKLQRLVDVDMPFGTIEHITLCFMETVLLHLNLQTKEARIVDRIIETGVGFSEGSVM